MNTTLEQRKFVVPEVVVGYESSLLIGQYLGHFGAKKAMIVTDKGVAAQVWFSQILGVIQSAGLTYIVFDDVSSNPKDYEAMLGAELFLAEDCDSIVAIGGGSPIDCAKAISIVSTNGGHILDYIGVDEIRLPGPPLICIPTTAGTAADVSQFAIITDTHEHIKKAIVSKKVVPDLALIDPLPLMTMDPYLTACTGMDALTHAIEAYVSTASSPLTDVHALKAIKTILGALTHAVSPGRTVQILHEMMMGSLHAGFAFSNASLGAVHALAHSLGGTLDLPHGECNSILLERIIDINYDYAKKRYDKIATLMGVTADGMDGSGGSKKAGLIRKVSELREAVGIPAFVAYDKPEPEIIDIMSHSAMNDPCMVTNPKPMTHEEVRDIYGKLFRR